MDKELKNMIRVLVSNQRKDIQKGVLSRGEAEEVLGVSGRTFKTLLKEPSTNLKKSKTMTGKYIYSSVLKEFERVHGYKYSEAI